MVPSSPACERADGNVNGAATLVVPPSVAQGLPQGGKDVMRFTAPPRGSFRITCGVPGHGASGMWIRLKVDPTSKSPSWVTS